MRRGDAALDFCGVEVAEVTLHRARCRLAVTSQMVNGHGVAHGGFIFILADTAFAYACNSGGDRAVARQCEITFLRPARAGDVLEADAVLRTRAGRSGIYDVRVSGQDGTVIAEMRGHSAAFDPRNGG
jgi:acyl-CoA thioesterase